MCEWECANWPDTLIFPAPDLREGPVATSKGETKGVQTGLTPLGPSLQGCFKRPVVDDLLFISISFLSLDVLNVKYRMHSTFTIQLSNLGKIVMWARREGANNLIALGTIYPDHTPDLQSELMLTFLLVPKSLQKGGVSHGSISLKYVKECP